MFKTKKAQTGGLITGLIFGIASLVPWIEMGRIDFFYFIASLKAPLLNLSIWSVALRVPSGKNNTDISFLNQRIASL